MSSRSSVRSCLITWCREQRRKIPDNDLTSVHTCTQAPAHACTHTLMNIYIPNTHTQIKATQCSEWRCGDFGVRVYWWWKLYSCIRVNCIVGMVTLIFCSIAEPSKVRIALRPSSSTSRFAPKKNGKQWWDGLYLWYQHLGDEGKMRFLGHPQVGIKFEASLWYMKPCPLRLACDTWNHVGKITSKNERRIMKKHVQTQAHIFPTRLWSIRDKRTSQV